MIPGPLRLFASFGYLLAASSAVTASPTLFKRADASSDGWTLSTKQINTTAFESQPYVANGYIGARLPAEGVGLKVFPAIDYEADNGTQGWPLFSYRQTASIVAGFYDQQGDTRGTNFVSIPIPHKTSFLYSPTNGVTCCAIGPNRWRTSHLTTAHMEFLIFNCIPFGRR
jgi:hypothetical protein